MEEEIKISEEITSEEDASELTAEAVSQTVEENEATDFEKKEKPSPLYEVYSVLHDLVYILAAVVLIFVFCVRLVGVNGDSMLPTLHDGDYLALQSNMIMGDLEQGDIIVARKLSFRDGEPIVKRVIATEGQKVEILYDENGIGHVYVDGVKLNEDYINEDMLPMYTGGDGVELPLIVEEGCVFVMGDNRNNSADSRYIGIGQIDLDQVLGKVMLIVFPGRDEVTKERDYSRLGGVD